MQDERHNTDLFSRQRAKHMTKNVCVHGYKVNFIHINQHFVSYLDTIFVKIFL